MIKVKEKRLKVKFKKHQAWNTESDWLPTMKEQYVTLAKRAELTGPEDVGGQKGFPIYKRNTQVTWTRMLWWNWPP